MRSVRALEELHGALMFLGCLARAKGTQVSSLAGLLIFLSRIQPIFPGFQFPNHAYNDAIALPD
jgi:hypothetical protein